MERFALYRAGGVIVGEWDFCWCCCRLECRLLVLSNVAGGMVIEHDINSGVVSSRSCRRRLR